MLHCISYLSYTLNMDFPLLKVKKNYLGSGILTNVSAMDI